jgi:hypothetical protein
MRPGDPRDMLEVVPARAEPVTIVIHQGVRVKRDGQRLYVYPERWKGLLALAVAAFVLGLATGLLSARVYAAPRPAQPVEASVPSSRQVATATAGRTGAPSMDSGTPASPSPTIGMRPASSKAPLPALVRSGIATWYRDTSLEADAIYAAMPEYRFGQTPYPVSVCTFDEGRSRCLTLYVLDHCQCYVGTEDERLIDLSSNAFRWFAPLSLGKVTVYVEVLR